jgi:hypothetical protein
MTLMDGNRNPIAAPSGEQPVPMVPETAGPEGPRQIALLGLPNTGTDWFVDLLLRQNPDLRYYREFFNPICNEKYEDQVGRAFGCETVGTYEKIADPRCPCEEVYEQTWAREAYNFTKENYSAFKVDMFRKKFACVVLHRRAELTLPGSRMQVKTWYDAMYWSLVRNRARLEADVRSLVQWAGSAADTVNKRQVAAFAIYSYQLLKEAKRYALKVLHYDTLLQYSPEELVPHLRDVPGVVDPERLAQDISQTRRPCGKDFGALGVDDFFARLMERAARCSSSTAAA